MSEDHNKLPRASNGRASSDAAIQNLGPFMDIDANGLSVASAFDSFELKDRVVLQLLFDQRVSVEQVKKAWAVWKPSSGKGESLWRVLAQQPGVNRTSVFAEASNTYGIEEISFAPARIESFIDIVRSSFTKEQWRLMLSMAVLPVGREVTGDFEEPVLLFAAHDPLRSVLTDFLNTLTDKSFGLRYIPEELFNEIIEHRFTLKNEFLDSIRPQEIISDPGSDSDWRSRSIDEEELDRQIKKSVPVNLFEGMLVEAVRQGASDIHVWPNDNEKIEISFRLDGKLSSWYAWEHVQPDVFLAVVKDNAENVDRFERDMAQDGYFQRWIDNTLIRFRVSILPITIAAQKARFESIVIRVLDDRKVVVGMRQLGLDALAINRFDDAISQPYGLVILTGPTGSGKTTTLNAVLQQVATSDKNVLTVEDPVEYNLPRVRQIRLGPKLRVEEAIRSILRHDPDIVMVGEMRDRETADLAIKLANTGHLTFSTLHTNDAVSAVSRLFKMGVEPFLLAFATNLIVAQRLVRTLCQKCKREDTSVNKLLLEYMGFTDEEIDTTTFFTAGGDPLCTHCGGNGYKGRRAITEALPVSEQIKRMIVTAKDVIDEAQLLKQAVEEGMLTLLDSARVLISAGETSVAAARQVVAGKPRSDQRERRVVRFPTSTAGGVG